MGQNYKQEGTLPTYPVSSQWDGESVISAVVYSLDDCQKGKIELTTLILIRQKDLMFARKIKLSSTALYQRDS
ncbi:hypothetical protein J6590_038809 [Homalodisca vitripennis]|nr:hypothetical protein J6590_038809 [Homalodisca vitripennis]